MNKYIALIFLVIGHLVPAQQAAALAVSDVELRSSLNQKLDARIYLLSATESELQNLQMNVIPINETGAGQLNNLGYEIVENEGRPFIQITSEDAVREPLLRFQLELNWSTGRLTRDYALIIDPQ